MKDHTLRRILVRSIIDLAPASGIVNWQLVNVAEADDATVLEFEGIRPYHLVPDGSTQKIIRRYRVLVVDEIEDASSIIHHTAKPTNAYGDINKVCHCPADALHTETPYRETQR